MAIVRSRPAKARRLLAPLPLLLLLLTLLAALAACAPNAASDSVLAARVNGRPISLAAYQRVLAVYAAIDAQQGGSVDWRTPTGRNALVPEQRNALDFLVNLNLVREQLGQAHITVPQKDLDSARKVLEASVAAQRDAAKDNPSAATTALLNALTPDAIELFAQQQAGQTVLVQRANVPSVHLRGMIVASQQEAEQYRQQAQQGADFAQLAKDHSLDKTSGASGGDLGTIYVGQLGQASPEFEDLVFAPGAHPAKYIVVPFSGSFALFEVTQPSATPLKDITDAATQQSVLGSWLQEVVRPGAKVETYVTLG